MTTSGNTSRRAFLGSIGLVFCKLQLRSADDFSMEELLVSYRRVASCSVVSSNWRTGLFTPLDKDELFDLDIPL